jgi:Glyoxalase superfamily protein
MRDFRDAKAMAHILRDAFKNRAVEITHSESLELIAKAFGYDNWNILAAKIEAARRDDGAPPASAPDAGAAATPQTFALPPDITIDIQPPSPDVPPEFAVFVGKWGGSWGGELASNVYVAGVTPTGDVRGAYAWGTSTFVEARGSINFRGRIKGGILYWGNAADGIGFEFKVTPDGRLQGERFNHGTQQGAVVMNRMAEQVQRPALSPA